MKHEWLTQEEADHKKLVQQASSIIDEEKMTKAISTEMLAIHKKIKERREAEEAEKNLEDEDIVLN